MPGNLTASMLPDKQTADMCTEETLYNPRRRGHNPKHLATVQLPQLPARSPWMLVTSLAEAQRMHGVHAGSEQQDPAAAGRASRGRIRQIGRAHV